MTIPSSPAVPACHRPNRRRLAGCGLAAMLPALLGALLLGACEQRPTPTPDLARGTALPPPGMTPPAAR